MAKEILQQAGGKAGNTIINIPESVKKNLPRDFDIGAIGKIDLREAETIANEDMFLVKENELIEGLEDFKIIPLKDEDTTAVNEIAAAQIDQRKIDLTAEIERIVNRIILHGEKAEAAAVDKVYDQEPVPVVEEKRESDFEYDDGRKWISLEELDKYDEHGNRWVPLEELIIEDGKDKREVKGISDKKAVEQQRGREVKKEALAEGREDLTRPREKHVMSEGYVEKDDEYVIWDIPVEVKAEEKSKTVQAESKEKTQPAVTVKEVEKTQGPSRSKETIAREDEVVISIEDLGGSGKAEKKVMEEIEPLDYSDTLKHEEAVDIIGKPEKLQEERIKLQYKDLVSSGILGESRETGKVYFIDDVSNGKEREDKSIFDESELDKIISGMVQVDEGSAYMLREANVDEDRERIAVISDEFAPAHEDLYVDLDIKYSDEELDYIHTAIVEEDYSSYISEIDEFFGIPGGRTIPAAVELLGLTADEFDTIEDMLFQDEFKDIHRYDRYHLYEFERAAREGTARDRKNCRYLLPEEKSLMDSERDSIESDVSSGSALIFEEDIRDITEQLIRRTGKTEAEIRDLVERTFGVESMMEGLPVETGPASVTEKEKHAAGASTKAPADGITDITDRVVILDNKEDVDRFVKEFPEGKQMNIKMLLKYLDGLFETLPEEIIKKFASSEYFELYLKVLNELGV